MLYKDMIKPINIIKGISETVQQTSGKIQNTSAQMESEVSTKLNHGDGGILQAYHGVKPKKLFENFSDFVNTFLIQLEKYKDSVPDKIYTQIKEAASNNNFSLSKIISDYYKELADAKSLKEVKQLYPEIKLPEKSPKEMLKDRLYPFFSHKNCKDLKNLKNPEEQDRYLDKIFDNITTDLIKESPVYPTLRKLGNEIKTEILSGNFNGNTVHGDYKYGSKRRIDMIEMIATEQNPDNILLQILKENYINGKNLTDITIKGNYYDFRATSVKRAYPFTISNKNFWSFIKNSEQIAQQFKDLQKLDKSEINSAIYSQTWKKSRLRADLGNMTAFGKDWSIITAVWQKTMFPETTFYPTEKLIDTYLLESYKAGKRNADSTNPFQKYLDNPTMDKAKIKLLKRLYKFSKTLDMDKYTLNSEGFKNFKSQFDTEAMSKTLEGIEEHYKNSFFKRFWTEERLARFKTALQENRELANKNIEISDTILTEAMNTVFIE